MPRHPSSKKPSMKRPTPLPKHQPRPALKPMPRVMPKQHRGGR